MKQTINGPVGIAIVVVVALVICVGFYMKYFHQTTMTPKEVSQSLAAGMKKTQDYMKAHGGQMPPTIAGQAAALDRQTK
ncbi:MAG TPA: hypothetical protein VGS41_10495 [Chthonomonadales bacterium]|nr:hypothetical protein [Chthonomonadales bacterium]